MYAWEKMFQQTALEKGKMKYKEHRVTELKTDGEKYTAAVLGHKRHEVSITMQDGRPKRGKCDCPVAKGRQLCAHMAALLYVIEDEKKRQEKKEQKEDEEKERRRLAREKRKEIKKQREIEKQQLEEARKRAAAEEAAREEEQKRAKAEKEAAEKARREERRRLEEEARRLADARREEEERERLAQEQERLERERREQMRKAEEEKDSRYTLLGEPWEDGAEQEETEQNEFSIIDLEHYRYFDITKIRDSVRFPADALRNGRRLFRQGAVKITKVRAGFDREHGEAFGEFFTTVTDRNTEIPQIIRFTRTAVIDSRCGCPQCTRRYYGFYSGGEKSVCQYSAAAMDALELYLQNYEVTDATDAKGWYVLDAFGGEGVREDRGDGDMDGGKLQLEARVSAARQGLEVSFRVGNSKMFVIKNLEEFCDNVRNCADETYGKNTVFNLARPNFTEEAKQWVDFIMRVEKENGQAVERTEADWYYYGSRRKASRDLDLYGWRLDAFFDTASKAGSVEYDAGGRGKKKYVPLKMREQNPKVNVEISEAKLDGGKDFHGIDVDIAMPRLYSGLNADYYIEGGYMNRTDPGFSEKLGALAEQEENGHVAFRVGRNYLNTFYYNVLPRLEEIARINEHSRERIRQYLTPEARFTFYLDADEGEVFCRIFAEYGQREFSLVETLAQKTIKEPYRDAVGEGRILNRALDWMPYVDEERDALSTGRDEEQVYRAMTEGVEQLLQMGEVRCTDSFRSRRVIRRVKPRVGVSVSEGLLELEISADGLDQKEGWIRRNCWTSFRATG